jgi:hypothetical protein
MSFYGFCLFYYIFSLQVDHSSLPAVFALLPDKSTATYERMFALIRNKLAVGFQPTSFMTGKSHFNL